LNLKQEALASTFFCELMKGVESIKGHIAYLSTEQREELKENPDELKREFED